MAKSPNSAAVAFLQESPGVDGIAHVHASFNNHSPPNAPLSCIGRWRWLRVAVDLFAAQVASEVAGRAATEQCIKTWTSRSTKAPAPVAVFSTHLGARHSINSIVDKCPFHTTVAVRRSVAI
jgi:ribosomal protein S11